MDLPKNSEYFPQLHIHILKVQAERWVKKYHEAPIKRILLYSYSFPFEGAAARFKEFKPAPMMYAVVFEIDAEDKYVGMTPKEQLDFDSQGVSGDRPEEPYERLLYATKPNRRLSDNEQFHDLMTRDFMNVYKLPPHEHFKDEWQFIVKFTNTDLNASIKTDEPFIVLWETTGADVYNNAKRIQDYCLEAIKYNFIDILRLCQVLANDPRYEKLLPQLWQRFNLDRGDPTHPKVKTVNDKTGSWTTLMARFMTGTVVGRSHGIRPIPYLKTYCKNDKTGKLELTNSDGSHVNLSDLNEYFQNILEIPLTPMLLPSTSDESPFSNLLDLQSLRGYAKEWVSRFPEIKRLLLFERRTKDSESSQRDELIIYAITSGTVSKEYSNWSDPCCWSIQDDLKFFYKKEKISNNCPLKWTWLDGKFYEPIPEEFIVPGKYCNLYPPAIQYSESPEPAQLNINQKEDNSVKKYQKSNESTLDDLLKKLNPDVEIFYEAMKRIVKDKNGIMHNLSLEIAIKAYNDIAKQIQYIQERDINQGIDYGEVETPSRDIKGQLLRNLIFKINPELYRNRDLPVTNYQALGDRYRKIAKSLARK